MLCIKEVPSESEKDKPTLYRAQKKAVQRVQLLRAADGPVRAVVGANTGCGKTGMCIAVGQSVSPKTILVVCPAIVRRHWANEFAKWVRRIDVGVIEIGAARKSGTKRSLLARDWALAQNVQIVSYALLNSMSAVNWDMIIFDEAHNLGDPCSQQSKRARKLVAANPNAHILMSTATLVPNEVIQLWHPMWLLQGDIWGKPRKTWTGPSWQFIFRYLEVEDTGYGPSPGRLRDDRAAELHRMVNACSVFVTKKDIAPDMPPLDVQPLYIQKRTSEFYRDWLDGLPADINKAIVLPYHKAEARMVANIAQELGRFKVFYIDGSIPPGQRSQLNDLIEASSEPTLLVATQESVGVGIRFMWAEQVLITEPQACPGRVAQLFGRFESVGSDARPCVHVAIEDGQESVAETLLARRDDINAVLQGNIPDNLVSVFQERPLTDERVADALSSLFGDVTINPDEYVREDDDDDE